VSVGATQAVLMAASLAKGDTVIENAAREPEIGDVAECLIKMGAKVEGVGSTTLRVQGTSRLEGTVHTVLPDRIETGTYAFAVAAAGGDVELRGARATVKPITIETQPFPGFPTDLQAQLMALMTRAEGKSVIRETIFENRFMHVQELARLGADIELHGDTATVSGVKALRGAR
jgi:UDP-N-acetylglucosamine 1-carboxyvinyltransferase